MHLGGRGARSRVCGGGHLCGQQDAHGGPGLGANGFRRLLFCCQLKIKYFHVSSSHSVPFSILRLKKRRRTPRTSLHPGTRVACGLRDAAQPVGAVSQVAPRTCLHFEVTPLFIRNSRNSSLTWCPVFLHLPHLASMSQGSGPPSSGLRTASPGDGRGAEWGREQSLAPWARPPINSGR